MKSAWDDPAKAERLSHGVEAMLSGQDQIKWATKPERIVASVLGASMISYTNQKKVGRAFCDIFVPPNTYVFVDGCYWHGCPIHYPNAIKDERITDKITRDAGVEKWFEARPNLRMVRIWEHDVEAPADVTLSRILSPPPLPGRV